MSDAVQQLELALQHQPANPLRNHQVAEYQAEAARLSQIINAPAYVTGVDRGAAAKRARDVNKLIEQQKRKPNPYPRQLRLSLYNNYHRLF